MQHLDIERLASFDHDAPSPDEVAHLDACSLCRTERNAFSALGQRAMHLADTPAYPRAARLTNWESLSTQLRAEGLIAGGAPPATHASAEGPITRAMHAATEPVAIESWLARARPRSRGEWWRVAAAAVMLAGVSGGFGRLSASLPLPSLPFPSSPVAENTSASAERSAADIFAFGGLGTTGYTSLEDANRALARNERDFDRISLWLTANDPSAKTSDILRRRLAALDQVIAATFYARKAAPQDRVLDHYFRAAYTAREATLQQLGGALPVGRSLERF